MSANSGGKERRKMQVRVQFSMQGSVQGTMRGSLQVPMQGRMQDLMRLGIPGEMRLELVEYAGHKAGQHAGQTCWQLLPPRMVGHSGLPPRPLVTAEVYPQRFDATQTAAMRQLLPRTSFVGLEVDRWQLAERKAAPTGLRIVMLH